MCTPPTTLQLGRNHDSLREATALEGNDEKNHKPTMFMLNFTQKDSDLQSVKGGGGGGGGGVPWPHL